jgi:predicted component of type VI protein secretion system
VSVRDLGSRNGTLVNGKALTEPCMLKDRDLVQVGPLTFAVSIQGAVAAAQVAAPPSPAAKAAPEDVNTDDIEAWLIADSKNPAPERPSGVYPGDTITITAFKDGGAKPKPVAKTEPAPAPVEDEAATDEEYERQEESEGDEGSAEAADDEIPEEFIDESNPFYVKKKPAAEQGPAKPVYKDTSDAASDILRKMMERRRSSR